MKYRSLLLSIALLMYATSAFAQVSTMPPSHPPELLAQAPGVIQGEEFQWEGLRSLGGFKGFSGDDEALRNLRNIRTGGKEAFLGYGITSSGADLVWYDTPQPIEIVTTNGASWQSQLTGDSRQTKLTTVVALKINNGYIRRYGERGGRVGINLDCSDTPVFEWEIQLKGNKLALYNRVVKDYLVYGDQPSDISPRWLRDVQQIRAKQPQPIPKPIPSPPTPDLSGAARLSTWSRYNCYPERHTVHYWTFDRNTGQWKEWGSLTPSWDNSGFCPGVGATSISINFEDKHQYDVIVVDPEGLACNGQNDPTSGNCWRESAFVVGDKNALSLTSALTQTSAVNQQTCPPSPRSLAPILQLLFSD